MVLWGIKFIKGD